MTNLSQTEIAYLAGIIDGEGSIGLAVRQLKYITPTLQITNTDRRIIDWLTARLPGTVYLRRERRSSRKDNYLWRTAGKQARSIIEMVRPYLVLKGEQADVVLAAYRKHARKPGRDSMGRLAVVMTQEEFASNVVSISKIRQLNRRGKSHAADGQGKENPQLNGTDLR